VIHRRPREIARHHYEVHPTAGRFAVRVFKQFPWLEADSVKITLSCPASQPSCTRLPAANYAVVPGSYSPIK
jgi:hypothetical protein